eukprot:comp24099_c0_seq1/m.43472 comp24099_c0_seq1/g.43472  ORF comp24099_c0_seq1/g.43472 comp24099_c0_seq1/m.43472 type:complete len:316 (+) comp24099_c0_seq1:3622-4569(+)
MPGTAITSKSTNRIGARGGGGIARLADRLAFVYVLAQTRANVVGVSFVASAREAACRVDTVAICTCLPFITLVDVLTRDTVAAVAHIARALVSWHPIGARGIVVAWPGCDAALVDVCAPNRSISRVSLKTVTRVPSDPIYANRIFAAGRRLQQTLVVHPRRFARDTITHVLVHARARETSVVVCARGVHAAWERDVAGTFVDVCACRHTVARVSGLARARIGTRCVCARGKIVAWERNVGALVDIIARGAISGVSAVTRAAKRPVRVCARGRAGTGRPPPHPLCALVDVCTNTGTRQAISRHTATRKTAEQIFAS